MSPTAPMYPDLQGSGSVFRLHKISEFEKILKLERGNRESLYKNIIEALTSLMALLQRRQPSQSFQGLRGSGF